MGALASNVIWHSFSTLNTITFSIIAETCVKFHYWTKYTLMFVYLLVCFMLKDRKYHQIPLKFEMGTCMVHLSMFFGMHSINSVQGIVEMFKYITM